MVRVLLTLWYTTTALLGPAACCCSYRTAFASSDLVSHVKAPAPKRSCCDSGPVEGCHQGNGPKGDHAPADCPCKHKKVNPLPPHVGAGSVSELIGQLRDLDDSFAGPPDSPQADALITRPTTHWTGQPLSGSWPSGRDLLTACQRLRC